MILITTRIIKRIITAVLYTSVGVIFTLIVAGVFYLDGRPDLKVWHEAELDAEFTVDSPVHSLDDYLALEDRLFEQLDKLVYKRIEPQDEQTVNRYFRGSRADPGQWETNWNRSFVLANEHADVGILMLHGLSDSPYSIHNMAESLHAAGAMVLGLRIPGHGTAPSGLTSVKWQDMAAAVELAMHHMQKQMGDKPVYIVGYSNGGALAVNYSLSALENPELPRAKGLFLMSPEIGVSPAAALAVWQARLGHLLGLKKLEWNTLLPEFDPYKYGSFAVNAGDLAYRLTSAIQQKFDELDTKKLKEFPPVLAFQSAVDATVVAEDLVVNLFERLTENKHELVIFDINRLAVIQSLLAKDPGVNINKLLKKPDLTFSITVMTNVSEESKRVVTHHRAAGQDLINTELTAYIWPDDLYSLSHIALPTPEDDPLYGGHALPASKHLQLGVLALRGERGVLQVSPAYMLRLNWNPFYPYLEQRLFDFVDLAPQAIEIQTAAAESKQTM